MKILLMVLIAGYALADGETENVNGIIEDIIEKIRNAIPEPIELQEYDLVIPDNFLVSGFLNATNFTASGLKAFTFKKGFLSAFTMGLDRFALESNYTMELPLLKIPLLSIFGDGSIRIVVSNVGIKGVIDVIGIVSGKAIKSFNLNLNSFEFSVTGVFDDVDLSKQISDSINKNAIEIFHKYQQNISELIRNVLNKVVDAVVNRNKTSLMDEVADVAHETGFSLNLWEALNHIFVTLL